MAEARKSHTFWRVSGERKRQTHTWAWNWKTTSAPIEKNWGATSVMTKFYRFIFFTMLFIPMIMSNKFPLIRPEKNLMYSIWTMLLWNSISYMNINLVLFNSIVLNAFYISITYNMNSWEWMTTDHSFQLRPNWVVQINKVSLEMDNRLFVILSSRS